MNNTIIAQLEKALEAKDEKEMRIRIEVLLDFLKDQPVVVPNPLPSSSPSRPIGPYYEIDRTNKPLPVTVKQPDPNKVMGGAVDNGGVIVGGEELTLTRPEGT